ncbi:hypothetical protein J6590_074129 [Homalodisca vitripennis]|nr:hypothetical protein J6590_074129 [Homalodisca vitripennis]
MRSSAKSSTWYCVLTQRESHAGARKILKEKINDNIVFERGGRIPVNGGDNFHQHLRDRPTPQGPVDSLKRNAIKGLAYIKLSTRDRRIV